MLPGLVHAAAKSSDKATHDGLRKLTGANFTLTDQGAWLIEFYSPTCVHCKRFGATWSELSQNKDYLRTQYPQAPFTLAQVDCLAQWDLCKEQGVTFLPRLTIYQDGKQNSEEYKGDRNYPEISAYIDKFAKQYRESKGVPEVPVVASTDANPAATDAAKPASDASAATSSSAAAAAAASTATSTPTPPNEPANSGSTSSSSSSSAAVEAIQEPLPSGPNPKGQLISYGSAPVQTKEQLAAWLGESSGQGPTFVKFFAPWCPHCKAMAAAFKQLSESLKGRVNALEVDCDANRALCASYDIRGYPVLRLYDQGHAKEYTGGRNHEAMLKWVLKAVSSSGLKPVSSSNELVSLAKDNEVLFLYLHSPGTPVEEVHAVEAASQVLSDARAPIFVSSEPALLGRYASALAQDRSVSVPATSGLLVFKDHSIAQPVSVLNPSTLRASDSASGQAVYSQQATSQIAAFLSREQYSLVTELTAANFEEVVRNKEDALVVLAALSDAYHGAQQADTPAEGIALKEVEIAALRLIALEWRLKKASKSARQVVFAWIDADRWKSPLKKLYGIDATKVPAAVLVDGNKLQYYDLPYHVGSDASPVQAQQWISQDVFAAIDNAVLGKTPPNSSRSLFQKSVRGAGNYMNAFVETCVAHPIVAFGFVFTVLGALFFYLGRTSTGSSSTLPLYSKVSTVKAD
ncbi:probable Pig2-related to protein disulfide isomerase [Sporisorium reilianum f. sp. reilianum]|uniref:Probable Pig2-related to protein disulfide isomerase n=1 Tax=Sporisorium reilianum f. sp. reilianum TaxID=72559 RepID=A0A2N8UNQ5_9BASI|nr:probable Pig2-related to protein disulfide isomerase [Sporisorium reilianum f. sp. reilianum]